MSTTVRESRNVFHENPIVFLQELQDAINDGFRVENTIPGYPTLNAILKEVRVFRASPDEKLYLPIIEDESFTVQNYDPMVFLMEFQVAVLAGYEVDPTAVSFDTMKTARVLKLKPKAAVKLDDSIAKPADEPKAAEAKPTRKQRKPKE